MHELPPAMLPADRALADPFEMPPGRPSIQLTDGLRMWRGDLLRLPGQMQPVVMFQGDPPPRLRELWVVRLSPEVGLMQAREGQGPGMICFTPGTRLATPAGPRLIEDLRPGDLVDTLDSGPRPVLWIGQRDLSAPLLRAMPELRPVRLCAGALGDDRPTGDLLVSPGHRMLIRSQAAQGLFDTPEVLVRAIDLVDGAGVQVERLTGPVRYIHVLLEAHHLVWAEGMATESFHPEPLVLEGLDPIQRLALRDVLPAGAEDMALVRRLLAADEAALLRRVAA